MSMIVAKINCNYKEIIVRAEELKYISSCHCYRFENPGVMPLMIIEVKNSNHINENYIMRFDKD